MKHPIRDEVESRKYGKLHMVSMKIDGAQQRITTRKAYSMGEF